MSTDRTPEQMVAEWRAENADDPANHNYEPGPDGCQECGDDEAGLLHAFDPNAPANYHDEAIYEVVALIESEAGALARPGSRVLG